MIMKKPEENPNQDKAGNLVKPAAVTIEDRPPEAEKAGFETVSGAASSMMDMQAALSRMEQIAIQVEQSKIQEYVCYLDNPKRVIRINFLMGLARGFGFAVGFALLAALVVYALQWVIRMNLPLISKFVADIFYLANQYLTLYGR